MALDALKARTGAASHDCLMRGETGIVNAYLDCWTSDAVRIIGPLATASQTGPEIRAQFLASMDRYSDITVESLVVENIQFSRHRDTALVEVVYRFRLIRRQDQLLTVKDSRASCWEVVQR